MITYKDLKIGMEVEARSRERTGKRWLPASLVAKWGRLHCVEVLLRYPSGVALLVYRQLDELRLKSEGGGG